MSDMIKVGMADLNVCKAPDSLTTLGLGSCIGACLYDPVAKVAGMLHFMLPDSTRIKSNQNTAKFGDTGGICAGCRHRTAYSSPAPFPNRVFLSVQK